ncbi:hypothetical protein Bhyg_02042 [Pseudolycoriella hygida]|uniref:Uncharacterized protein n=1 Tax=Pseudolycoriella hygida TaxID=35572 RepID=A0A9Q0NB52_9DIPT|nr:hypothetical protein Bhyg_02042 [Pseudolycoriella hygida]
MQISIFFVSHQYRKMKIKLLVFILCSNFRNLFAEWDRLILYEEGGILLNETTGFTTTQQRVKSVFCGGQKECTMFHWIL